MVSRVKVGDAELARVQQQRADARQEAQRLTLQLHNHTHDAERLQVRANACKACAAMRLQLLDLTALPWHSVIAFATRVTHPHGLRLSMKGRLENAVASAEAAQLEGQQLRKALNEQQNEAEKMKGQVKEAAQNAECAGQQIQHLTTETAGVRAGMLFASCRHTPYWGSVCSIHPVIDLWCFCKFAFRLGTHICSYI